MTKKGYDLIQLVLNYGYVNFKGGVESIDWNEFVKQDEELYEQICKAVNELDDGGKNEKVQDCLF